MSNEFDRYTTTFDTFRFFKFVAGVRLHARATDSVDNIVNIAWRGSPAHGMRARRLRGI